MLCKEYERLLKQICMAERTVDMAQASRPTHHNILAFFSRLKTVTYLTLMLGHARLAVEERMQKIPDIH